MMGSSGTVSSFVGNIHTDIVACISTSGTVSSSTLYSPYGEKIAGNGTSTNPIGYQSDHTDPVGLVDKITTAFILCSMKTVISVKVDKEIKEAAQEVAKSAGLSLSALVNAYLRQVVATRRIEIYSPEPMTPHLEELIAEVEGELKSGKASKGFDNADDFLKDLKR